MTPSVNEVDSPFAVTLPQRPYPGLRPFTKDEWPIFFGRERMADEIVTRLIEQRLLVVHGDSGCGKSSLIAAAVLPRLEQESARGGLRWMTCVTHPGDSPLWNLANDVAPLVDLPADEAAIEIRRALNFGRGAPAAVAKLLRRDSDDCVCILIDQFEELFAQAAQRGPDEARLLTAFLTAAREEAPDGLYLVLTMRSEFLGACARFNGFAEAVNATQYLLPRLGHDDLLRAIREPAAMYNGEIARDLAEKLIADAGGGQDQLPLMQHGLMLLHRDCVLHAPAGGGTPAANTSWRLGLEQYRHRGGLKKLLSDHADAVMRDALRQTPDATDGEGIVERIFRALTSINAEGQAVRRPQTFARLLAVTGAREPELRSIIDTFRAEGVSFLRPYGSSPLGPDSLIDISHEALIRCWDRIADPADGWLLREFRDCLVFRSLLVQADSFERDPTNVLGPTTTDERGAWLKRHNQAWAERYGGGWERVEALLVASAAARDKERAEREAIRARAERSKRLVVALQVLLVLLLMLGAVGYAVLQQREAEARARLLEVQAQSSADHLLAISAQLKTAASASPSPQASSTAAQEIEALANQLSYTAQTAVAAPSTPRVYLHITDEKDRAAAHAFELSFEAATVGGDRIVVPGIELVSAAPPKSVLRCFLPEDCKGEGPALVKIANGLLKQPQLELQDLSGRYGQGSGIRPRHYEIWFAPGDAIVPASARAKY